MDSNYKAELEAMGVDVDLALGRFLNNEKMYMRFLLKFLDDKSLALLESSIAEDKLKDAFLYAHNMKGLTANLGINSLSEILTPMVEQLRRGETTCLSQALPKLQATYDEVCVLIKKMKPDIAK